MYGFNNMAIFNELKELPLYSKISFVLEEKRIILTKKENGWGHGDEIWYDAIPDDYYIESCPIKYNSKQFHEQDVLNIASIIAYIDILIGYTFDDKRQKICYHYRDHNGQSRYYLSYPELIKRINQYKEIM